MSREPAPAPLYRDPVTDGATDPIIVRNHLTDEWWMFYTQRRPADEGPGVRWVHGTDIGVAISGDSGRSWHYRGTAKLSDSEQRDTFWAPEVIFAEGCFHMFVSVLPGVRDAWVGPAAICHYTSPDLHQWQFRSRLDLGAERVIDACVCALPEGGYRMWFKNEDRGGYTDCADSDDLFTWQPRGPVLSHRPHEGPNVFQLGDWYWMIVDEWRGQGVFRSADLARWEPAGLILAKSSERLLDRGPGLHADVLVIDDVGYVLYFTHPGRTGANEHAYDDRYSVVQLATVTAHRDELHVDRESPTLWPSAAELPHSGVRWFA